jgi:hypothetical protein
MASIVPAAARPGHRSVVLKRMTRRHSVAISAGFVVLCSGTHDWHDEIDGAGMTSRDPRVEELS